MPVIGWDEASPSDGESVGLGDDRIRSLKTSLRQGLDAEHNWPSAGGETGAHRYGSARPYYGPQSAVSSSGTNGRLMQTSDTSRLFGVGSGGTTYLGGPTAISAGSFPGTVPQRHHWVMEFGQAVTNSTGTALVTIPNSGYSGIPYITVTPVLGPPYTYNTNVYAGAWVVDGTSFIAYTAEGTTYSSTKTFHWQSIGSRVL